MNRNIIAKLLAGALAIPIVADAWAGSDDILAGATPIDGESGLASGSTTGSEAGMYDPMHQAYQCACTVWYKWTAKTDGLLRLRISTGYFDTLLGVYSAAANDSLDEIAIDDDGGEDLLSALEVDVESGKTYYIAVGGYYDESGYFELQWEAFDAALLKTVTFDAAGGEVSEQTRRVEMGRTIGPLPTPSRDKYAFAGWYVETEGGEAVDADWVMPSSDVTLHARWLPPLTWRRSASAAISEAKRTGKLIFFLGGRETCGITTGTRDYSCEDPSVRKILGEYVTWFCNCDKQESEFTRYTSGLGSFPLPLVCVINPYNSGKYLVRSTGGLSPADILALLKKAGPAPGLKTVGFDANGGTVTEPSRKVAQGFAIGTLPTPVRPCYSFSGWWTKKSGGTKITAATKMPAKNVTYYAHWTPKKYKVSVSVSAKAAGTVSGAGTKAYGSKVTLKATPKKGYVFVKWENLNAPETPWPSAVKCRQPSVAFAVPAANVSVRAVFAKASADAAPVLSVAPSDDWYVESEPDREIAVAAESLSYPTVTMSGAPAGIGLVRVPETDCEYVLKVADAAKVKPGVYTAKITAKNRAGKSAAKSVRIVAPNSSSAIADGLIAGLETSTISPYVAPGGMNTKWTLADLGVEVFATNGWKLASVTGLPTGLSWNGTAIVGAASKTGLYTVTFTMKKTVGTGKKAKTYTSTATATFKVGALLPAALAGTYNGFANTNVLAPDEEDEGEGEGDDEETYGVYTPLVDGWASAAKVTVTTAGNITAKIGGVTLSGAGFDSESNGVYAVTLRKTQKITKGSLKGKTKVWEAYFEIDTNAAWDAVQLVGWYRAYTTGLSGMTAPAWIVAQRNPFALDEAKAVSAAVVASGKKGVEKLALQKATGGYAYDLVCASCTIGAKAALTATAKANGTVTLAGKIGSKKVSGTAVLDVSPEVVEMYEDWDEFDNPIEVPVFVRTATARFFSGNFVIEIVYTLEDGAVVSAAGKVWKK